jgi:shikimate kinase
VIRHGGRHRTAEERPEVVAAITRLLGRRSLVFVGLMGCGKTSVGRRVAARLGLRFTDTDEEIEFSHRKTIPEIFTDHGEPYFRDGERRVIARLLNSPPQVLATGGGAYMNEETRRNIRATGIAIWLKADLPVLMRRVMKRENRPLLKAADPEAVMRNFMTVRYPVYAEADITVQTRDVPHEVMAGEVIDVLYRLALQLPAPQIDGADDAAVLQSRSMIEPPKPETKDTP